MNQNYFSKQYKRMKLVYKKNWKNCRLHIFEIEKHLEKETWIARLEKNIKKQPQQFPLTMVSYWY